MRHWRRLRRDDRGFTVVELLAGLMLSALCFVMFTAVLGGALRSSRDSRMQEAATVLATDRIEAARALRWEELALYSVDTAAPHLTGSGTALAGAPFGIAADEPLVVCPTGVVAARASAQTAGTSFATWTYVTDVSSGVRRVVVFVEWNLEGAVRSYEASTTISRVAAAGDRVGTGFFPNAAVIAMDDVTMSGGAFTASSSAGQHTASALANGDFKDGTARVDGDIRVGGTATATAANVAGIIEQNAGVVVSMPPATDVEAWRAELRSSAQAGAVYSGTVRFSNQTITAPIYVNGTIEFEGAVTINGAGPVYATNAIKVRGAVVTSQASPLVADTLIEFSGGGQYRVEQFTEGGLVSFGTTAQSLKLSGGSAGTVQGVAFAPYGGIVLSGTSSWIGSLIAGGPNGTGDVLFSGGSSVLYPSGLTTSAMVNRFFVPSVESSCG
ncbi:MAG: hypothetical protein HZA58_09185 [Acidimicrobiia bacterium]|nr:hypothetical protein [Acidimicrobiia bacterium]